MTDDIDKLSRHFFDPATRFIFYLLAGSGTAVCTLHLAVHVLLLLHDVLKLNDACHLMPLLCSDDHVIGAITIGT